MKRFNLIFYLVIFAVGNATAQKDLDLKLAVLNMEVESIDYGNIKNHIFLESGENKRLGVFLGENVLDSINNNEFNDLVQALNYKDANLIFNKKQVDDFLRQLSEVTTEIIYLVDLPDKNKFSFNPTEAMKENHKEITIPGTERSSGSPALVPISLIKSPDMVISFFPMLTFSVISIALSANKS